MHCPLHLTLIVQSPGNQSIGFAVERSDEPVDTFILQDCDIISILIPGPSSPLLHPIGRDRLLPLISRACCLFSHHSDQTA
jgi:hypothetical protein